MSNPRITYNGITINFDRGLNGFDYDPTQVKNVIRSRNGKAETNNFYSIYGLRIARQNASADLKNQLEALWNYLRTGNTCALWHDPDLKGVWTFEGGTLVDLDGNAPTTSTGTMSYPAGKFGLGLSITTQTVYYNVDTFFADPPPKGTIAFWFAPSFNVAGNAANHTLFQIDSASGDPVSGAYWTSGNNFLWGVNAAASSPIVLQSSVSSYLQDAFHHFAVTWDSTIADGGKMYLDGVLVASSTNSSFTVKSTGTNFRLGYDGTDRANGVFDDFLIRSDVLSAYDISQLASGRTSLWPRRNYFPSLMTDDFKFNCVPLVGTPYYSIEMNFKEVL